MGSDVVIHAAGVNRGTDQEIIVGSVITTHNLINHIERTKRKPHIIFISSIQAENDSVYGKSKRLAEIILEDASKRLAIPIAVLRLTNVFGERGKPFYNSVVANFCHQIAQGKDIQIKVDKKVQLLYIQDLINIIMQEIENPGQGYTIKTISSDDEILVSDLAAMIKSFPARKARQLFNSSFEEKLYATYCSYGLHE